MREGKSYSGQQTPNKDIHQDPQLKWASCTTQKHMPIWGTAQLSAATEEVWLSDFHSFSRWRQLCCCMSGIEIVNCDFTHACARKWNQIFEAHQTLNLQIKCKYFKSNTRFAFSTWNICTSLSKVWELALIYCIQSQGMCSLHIHNGLETSMLPRDLCALKVCALPHYLSLIGIASSCTTDFPVSLQKHKQDISFMQQCWNALAW